MINRKKVIAISIIILLFLGVYLYLKNPSFYYYSLSECGTGASAPVPTRISFFNIGLVVGEEQITFLPYKEYKVVSQLQVCEWIKVYIYMRWKIKYNYQNRLKN